MLRRIVQEARTRRLARTDSLLNIEFVAVSAPVFDHEGRLAAALTVLGPEGRLDTAFEGEAAAALTRAAADASAAMGHRPALAAQP